MIALTWLRGLLAHRRSRLLATAVGVAVAVALLASIGAFLSSTTSQMTDARRAAGAVDWQVEAQPARSGRASLDRSRAPARRDAAAAGRLRARPPGCSASDRRLDPADRPGSGPRACPPATRRTFPGELRTLAGLRQRRAARPADRRQPARQARRHRHHRPRRAAAGARVHGRRRRRPPAADSLFQQVGAPVGAQPPGAARQRAAAAPRRLRSRVEPARRAPACHTQIHAALAHRAARPARARRTRRSPAQRRNLETQLAGAGLVGDNLGTRARPGAQGRALRPAAVPLPRRPRRDPRRPAHRLDRRRPAPTAAAATRRCCAPAAPRPASSSGVALAETALAGGRRRRRRPRRRAGDRPHRLRHRELRRRHARRRRCGPAAPRSPGLSIAAAAIALPAWRDARALTVAGQRAQRRPPRARAVVGALRPRLRRAGRRRRSSTGRPRETATASCSRPRASPQVSVNWYALLAPVLGWIGAGLLAYRLADLVLRRGRAPLARLLRPLAGELSPTVAATMGRQRRLLAGAVDAGRADGRLRRLDRGLQRDLPAAGRGRRAALQRRRRHRDRVARRQRRARGAAPSSRRSPGVAQRRAAAAPLRLRRRRPPGPLRRATRRRSAPPASSRTRGSPGGTRASCSCARSPRSPDSVLVSRRDGQGLPAAPGRPAPPAAAGRPDQAVQDRPVPLRRRRQGVPDRARATRSSSPTPSYVAQADRQRRRRHLPRPDRRHRARRPSPRRVRAQVGTSAAGHRHRQPAQGDRLQPDRRRALGPDQGRARLRAACSPPPPPGWRSASASASAAARFAIASALGAQAPAARRLRLGRVGVRHGRRARARRRDRGRHRR